jgi:elongation factor P--beta-lysine ligase
MTERIASDIQDNFAIGKAFRNRKKGDLPPPDFLFAADDESRP